jgi:hypothetical protein
MDEHIEYTGPLTGTLAEAVEAQNAKQAGPKKQTSESCPTGEKRQPEWTDGCLFF